MEYLDEQNDIILNNNAKLNVHNFFKKKLIFVTQNGIWEPL